MPPSKTSLRKEVSSNQSEVLIIRLKEQKQTLTKRSGKLEAELELLHSELVKLHEKNAMLANKLREIVHSPEELNDDLVSQNSQTDKIRQTSTMH